MFKIGDPQINKILLPYQKRFIDGAHSKRYSIFLASRQVGKSFTLSLLALMWALERKNVYVLVASASERQSLELTEKVKRHIELMKTIGEKIKYNYFQDASLKSHETRFPNGSRIISVPANPDTIRGFSGHIIIDEMTVMRDSKKIWQALLPTTTRGYRAVIASTPKGKSDMFYDLWMAAEKSSNWYYQKTGIHEAINEGLSVDLQAIQSSFHPDDFAQEYECEFLDEASAFLTYELIISCELDRMISSLEDAQGDLYLGMDIGRKRDLSVIWVVEKLGQVKYSRVVKILEKAPFHVQRDALFEILKHKHMTRACIDATGLGMQLAEEAQRQFGKYSVEAINFTHKVKEELAYTMRTNFEDRTVYIPPDSDIREDLHSVRKITTSAGNIRFDSERSDIGHADRFWALALALHAASNQGGPVVVASRLRRESYDLLKGYW